MKNIVKEGIFFFICGIALLAYSLINHYSTSITWSLSPYLFPLVVSLFFIVLSCTLFFSAFSSGTKKSGNAEKSAAGASASSGTSAAGSSSKILWKPVLIFIAAVSVYYVIMPFIGFIASNIILLAFLFVLLGERVWWKILSLSVVTTLVIYYFFHTFLHVMLP